MKTPNQVLYQLRGYDYEGTTKIMFEGPEVKDFKKYCDSLMPKAAKIALKQAKDMGCPVDFDDMIDGLVEVLIQNGYKKIEPEESNIATYYNDFLCLYKGDKKEKKEYIENYGKEAMDLVLPYNEFMHVKINREIKAVKKEKDE